jgi:hypothetical protein
VENNNDMVDETNDSDQQTDSDNDDKDVLDWDVLDWLVHFDWKNLARHYCSPYSFIC